MNKIDQLQNQLTEAIKALISEFEQKNEVIFEYWMTDDPTSIAYFGSELYFSLSDICFDLFSKQPPKSIVRWFYDIKDTEMECVPFELYINLN